MFLRGRYEIQVAYAESKDNLHSMGAIYGFLAPSVELPARPGRWESFDVTLLGRYLTIFRDGVTIIVNREIPGITGAALDSNEDQAGPFYIQGGHSGGIRYRNITVSVPKLKQEINKMSIPGGVTKPGTVSGMPVCSIDFMPTIVDMAGGKAPKVDGVKIKDAEKREALYWHYPHYSNQGGLGGAVRKGDWKLIEFYEDNCLELFNLKDDIGEQKSSRTSSPLKKLAHRSEGRDAEAQPGS